VDYFDGQFDDARLAVTLAQTAARRAATMLNYDRVLFIIPLEWPGACRNDGHPDEPAGDRAPRT